MAASNTKDSMQSRDNPTRHPSPATLREEADQLDKSPGNHATRQIMASFLRDCATQWEHERICDAAGEGRQIWQPIETAPKPMQVVRVLVFAVYHRHAVWGIGHWHQGVDGGSSGWIAHSFYSHPDTFSGSFEPTHWMPLPDPPKAEGR